MSCPSGLAARKVVPAALAGMTTPNVAWVDGGGGDDGIGITPDIDGTAVRRGLVQVPQLIAVGVFAMVHAGHIHSPCRSPSSPFPSAYGEVFAINPG